MRGSTSVQLVVKGGWSQQVQFQQGLLKVNLGDHRPRTAGKGHSGKACQDTSGFSDFSSGLRRASALRFRTVQALASANGHSTSTTLNWEC